MAFNIPERIKKSLDRYATEGVPTGDFLRAVLENDLMQAIGRADDDNRAAIFDICAYVYNELPHDCHGSGTKFKAWIDTFAAKRIKETVCQS